ncbi:alpha-D-ribose 1-methylphosphonate 5-triphosphate diphosphatase [uncultured Enterovirga sp.]|uniref:alpha-D-ribose 1-methylphosphonate 5-triphosphate diphosphatase n=1 Tax=uncultured Enterovirga sp. TaxID=2026352 RepID=UPI0035C9DB4D
MADECLFANAALVLPDRVIERGWIATEGGLITEIGEGDAPERGQDCAGDTLVPGLVELHTDHLESHYAPRPKVRWDPVSAVLAYDAQIASSGITTVFDSLRVGSDADSASIGEDLMALAGAIASVRNANLLRVDHRTHLRCEIASPNVTAQAEEYLALYPADLMSLMDHTPGQRQFTSLATWKAFYARKTPFSNTELDAFIDQKLATHQRYAVPHRRWLVEAAREAGIVLASHDDATAEHVAESACDGVGIAEFPTTMAAAEASREAGLKIMMGAPNVIRGGSHSGNVAAEDLARRGMLDILSSDYVPASLLMAAFDLPRRVPAISLPEAIRTVTSNPAEATGLTDRGAIAVGRRADLVRVARHGDTPVVRHVYRAGARIV